MLWNVFIVHIWVLRMDRLVGWFSPWDYFSKNENIVSAQYCPIHRGGTCSNQSNTNAMSTYYAGMNRLTIKTDDTVRTLFGSRLKRLLVHLEIRYDAERRSVADV